APAEWGTCADGAGGCPHSILPRGGEHCLLRGRRPALPQDRAPLLRPQLQLEQPHPLGHRLLQPDGRVRAGTPLPGPGAGTAPGPPRRIPALLLGLGSEVLGVKGGQGERTPCLRGVLGLRGGGRARRGLVGRRGPWSQGGGTAPRRGLRFAPQMAQELGISEKSPDYRNPFKTDHSEFFPSADTFQKALREEEKRRKKEEKRKEIRKGPRISRSQSE
uniref:Coiled-coil domain containing 134 n=1 Tax=Buteo japonicus TaxID=224669 RepID=A0A8C0AN07_9AVES